MRGDVKKSIGWGPWVAAAAWVAAGCGDAGTTSATPARDAATDAEAAVDAPATGLVVRLAVDANRDGTVSPEGDDGTYRGAFDAQHGAVFLANVDDDDTDGTLDGADTVVNGDADALDLARIRVVPVPGAPDDATGRIALTAPTTPEVHLFRNDGGAWTAFHPAIDTISAADLRAGVELGIEATEFPTATWNGDVSLSLTVSRGGAAVGTDRVALRVAPFVVHMSTDRAEQIYATDGAGYASLTAFMNDLSAITSQDDMDLEIVDGLDSRWAQPNMGPDVWTQDYMEFGWTAMPGASGPTGMHVVLRTPRVDRAIAQWTRIGFVGPDHGYTWHHQSPYPGASTHDPSLDSFGNLEVLPTYPGHPLGRVFCGNVPTRQNDAELRAFIDAQRVQGPVFTVDTSWLHVGNVDEFTSFIPANTPRGWKLLVASPRGARAQMQALVAANPANGLQEMFVGERWYPLRRAGTSTTPYAAARTINAILADADLMTFNQNAQAHIDTIRQQIQTETGVTDDEVIEIPFLMWEIENGQGAAYMPGTVNLLLYGHTVVMARPHSATIDGGDYTTRYLQGLLTPEGITPRFAEQWDILHAAEGEVHCGTNAVRQISPHTPWWEVNR